MYAKQLTPTFLHRAAALLEQSTDVLTAMRKYQSYYCDYSARLDYHICDDTGRAAVLTTKFRPKEHAANTRNKHDPNIHWLEKTLLSSHRDAEPWCYQKYRTHLATMRPLRLPVSHQLQRDCQTSSTIGKRCQNKLLDSHGRNNSKFGHACW